MSLFEHYLKIKSVLMDIILLICNREGAEFMGNFGVLISIVSAYYLYSRAKKENISNPVLWAVGGFFFWIIVIPVFLYKYRQKSNDYTEKGNFDQQQNKKRTGRKKSIIIGVLAFVVISIVAGYVTDQRTEAKIMDAIKSGDMAKANLILSEHPSVIKKDLKDEIANYNSYDYFINILRNLSDEDFAKIKNGDDTKVIFKNADLNKLMLAKIRAEDDKSTKVIQFDEAEAKRIENEKQIAAAQEIVKKGKERMEKIKRQFSSWDGSHIQLERILKKNLKDPDSYQHIESSYKFLDNGNIKVYLKYRAKNSFGGYNIGVIAGEVTVDGTVLSVEEVK